MIGGVRIRTERGPGGDTRIVELTATAPFAAKIAGGAVHLVGSAASPLDGDHITFDLDVAPGTSLTVRTVAATMAWPGRPGAAPSRMDIRARVGDGALLRWLPEPLVPVHGCRHELHTQVQLARTARLVWREELVLGRTHESPGSLRARTRIERAGEALLHQDLTIDGHGLPRHQAPSILGQARGTGSVLVVGPGAPEHCATVCTPELHAAVLELEAGGRLASATASSIARMLRWLDEREAGLTAGPDWLSPVAAPAATPEVLAP